MTTVSSQNSANYILKDTILLQTNCIAFTSKKQKSTP